MPQAKRMFSGNGLARVKGAKRILFVPQLLPFWLDKVKRVLPATARHRRRILRKGVPSGNVRVVTEPGLCEKRGFDFLRILVK
jgi:hypothetical protein